ncbi:DUF1573 domain-containing protein [Flammeovirga sp. MY04]|uniref:DUF1573 domain-containing protein n=1 Tax=Flammeovirga sp. MY04 TaxID=1191459 RepID=UPI000806233C|nr:DUF1573 domain-containing protein [Flammeovirga sp. MY04]ANQ50487.1 DUF1573 domain-containing protein [Flammeovirga sp. MY04]
MKILKTLSVFIISAVLFISCGEKKESNSQSAEKGSTAQASNENAAPKAKFDFEETEFDFGDINEGDVVTHVFKYKNVGEVPLQITNVQVSCGCTAPNWDKTPLAPGESSELQVTFNSRGKRGKQIKKITILANVEDGMDAVVIKTKVAPKDQPQAM